LDIRARGQNDDSLNSGDGDVDDNNEGIGDGNRGCTRGEVSWPARASRPGTGDEQQHRTVMTTDGTDEMRAHMLHFSRGVHTCPGRGIAMVKLRLAVAVARQ
jgi:hypothetical protein